MISGDSFSRVPMGRWTLPSRAMQAPTRVHIRVCTVWIRAGVKRARGASAERGKGFWTRAGIRRVRRQASGVREDGHLEHLACAGEHLYHLITILDAWACVLTPERAFGCTREHEINLNRQARSFK
ncbi:hypothetical protein CDL15_Pgr026979 [Punica granatum]|uniref:Uncharacterized protein n=1 Tax=Punica granatum TaxID=22663 RepID=A0A218W6P6_PUNGR|nr:hypothetical protein CDL15_Pgr026979 [Punica granatum]PKI42440.1 hypothetical protein CRG98_037171 [Punica granatum]